MKICLAMLVQRTDLDVFAMLGFHDSRQPVRHADRVMQEVVLTAVTKLCWQDGADNYWKCVTRWLAAPGFMPGGIVSSEMVTADEAFLRETPK